MEKIIIAAMSKNNVIAQNGKIPWHIKEDMQHFRNLTVEYPVIMGRKTFESLDKKPLDHRDNIVVTRDIIEYRGLYKITLCNSIDLAFKFAESFQKYSEEKIYVIGGGQIYSQTIDLVDKLELTVIDEEIVGDTYFPKIDQNKWEEIKREDSINRDYSFRTYIRK
jgi:dihydrofolate reductase